MNFVVKVRAACNAVSDNTLLIPVKRYSCETLN